MRDDELRKLADWLRNESEERMKHAMSRKHEASIMEDATVEELRASKALAEIMAGRKLDDLSAVESAYMQGRIASKLESEARQLAAWADAVSEIVLKKESND